MLNEKRINDAKSNVKNYLNDGLIKKINKDGFNNNIFNIYLKNSQESLEIAKYSINSNKSFLWGIVCSYYSMFYCASALLYFYGYKVSDKIVHKVTCDALIVLVSSKIKNDLIEIYEEIENDASDLAQFKTDTLIENLDFERNKRSKFQYNVSEELKLNKAKTSFERAKEFNFEVKQILGNKLN